MDYLAAIQTAERTKPACIVIDSLSHEHDGEGGTLDCVTAEFVEFYSQALRSQRTVGASIEVALAPDREINSGFRGTRVSHQCTFGKATGDTIIP
ncbi:MAG: hypothetical protein EOP50_06570 [Sphingobacteriales bacterium]|nr:MAG: hypothetical protein EOP50_06570 [Sphingobacteriales bacterium]